MATIEPNWAESARIASIARTGFDQWFQVKAPGQPSVPVWKQNMMVLLMLYPVVFLFGYFVQTPFLIGRAGLPFAGALFIGNVISASQSVAYPNAAPASA